VLLAAAGSGQAEPRVFVWRLVFGDAPAGAEAEARTAAPPARRGSAE
jgi:hypothetical protein